MTSRPVRITRDRFIDTPREAGHDAFAGTFVAKADMMGLWRETMGFVDMKGRVKAAICMRINKRTPPIANLQLLHTFYKHRRKGLATVLVLTEYAKTFGKAVYFRVSSEAESVEFYRSLGLRFWGEQKSGSLLCMHKIMTINPAKGLYDLDDIPINNAVYTERRGGVVRFFATPR